MRHYVTIGLNKQLFYHLIPYEYFMYAAVTWGLLLNIHIHIFVGFIIDGNDIYFP